MKISCQLLPIIVIDKYYSICQNLTAYYNFAIKTTLLKRPQETHKSCTKRVTQHEISCTVLTNSLLQKKTNKNYRVNKNNVISIYYTSQTRHKIVPIHNLKQIKIIYY